MPATTRSNRKVSTTDSYLALIRRFPLRPIKGDVEHERATQIITELIARPNLDSGPSDYLDTLILLVNKYEDEHHTISAALTPQNALKAIMRANNLTQRDIGKLIGSDSAVSMFFSGQRQLSKSQIKALAERFRVNPLLFL